MKNDSGFIYPALDPEATGANIRQLRLRKGITVKEIEDNCFLTSPRVIYKWEKGRCLPAVENLLALSRMFGVTIEEILVEKNTIPSDFGRRDDPDRPLFLPYLAGMYYDIQDLYPQ